MHQKEEVEVERGEEEGREGPRFFQVGIAAISRAVALPGRRVIARGKKF